MLLKLSAHISNCLERATEAEHRALQSADSATRRDHEMMAQSWRYLARSYEFVEALENFLSETKRNKSQALPPEIQAFIDESRVAPESKPVIRRRRVKHEASFKDRLLKSAEVAREHASRMPSGVARDRLLQKAQQSENAASIDAWISSPGSPPPENFAAEKKPKV